MDPRASHELVSGMVRCCKPRDFVRKRPTSPYHDRAKRYGTYFPSKASFDTKWNFTDDESTWEFSAPVAPYPRSDSTNTFSSSSSTPAQEIILRYRAGMPPLLRSSVSSATSSDSAASYTTAPPGNCESMSSEKSFPVSEHEDFRLQARHRQSRSDALAATLEEAMAVMKQGGKGDRDKIVCHRPGCRDTVHGARALMYHLHIHDIHTQSLICTSCDQYLESALQLNSHRCLNKAMFRSPPSSSPLKDGLRRVLSKLGYRPQF